LSLKQSAIPTPNYLEFRLVLTLEFASANSSASTHTNYLDSLLKNDPQEIGADPQLYRPSAIVD
jgi:hypothetical protein